MKPLMSLSDALCGLKIPAPPKVIGDPTRTPVDKQAAMIFTKAHRLHMPPMPPEPPKKSELEFLREEVAILRAANIQLKHENNALRRKFNRKKLPERKAETKAESKPQLETIVDRKRLILERLSSR